MASKRNLKKDINYLTYELLAECFTYQFFHADLDSKKVNEVSSIILNTRNDLIKRINHIENKDDPKLVKEYFKKIRSDFKKSVDALEKLEKK